MIAVIPILASEKTNQKIVMIMMHVQMIVAKMDTVLTNKEIVMIMMHVLMIVAKMDTVLTNKEIVMIMIRAQKITVMIMENVLISK